MKPVALKLRSGKNILSRLQNSYCPDVFNNIYVEPVNDDSINIGPCCISQHQLTPVQDFEFDQHLWLEQIRQETLQELRPSACAKCWQIEDSGGRSRRQAMLDEKPIRVTKSQLRSLDLNITWACNLACVMCGPQWSSSWAQELGIQRQNLSVLGREANKHNDWISKLDLSAVQSVHFNGGEPLINHAHEDILRQLHNHDILKHAHISYNTNGTCYPNHSTIALWQQAKLVKLYFSIDAVGRQFEYIRYPASWELVTNNIARMRQQLPGNVMFGVNVTVGCYNIFEIVDVLQWFRTNLSNNRDGDASDFVWQLSNGFDLRLLNDRAKQSALVHLAAWPELDALTQILQQSGLCDDTWCRYLDKLDKRRLTNWRQTLTIGTYY